ncbi:hypothetical protein B5S29_g510 [[Candida] boidinii]|nr:hypothetical protein B5S29_g510 [[Candida] boidinii]
MSYYDLDDILADSQKLPCKFSITVPGLGYLQGQPGKRIKKDSILELPIWLAEILAVCAVNSNENENENEEEDDDQDNTNNNNSQNTFLQLIQPDYFSPKIINAIKADSLSLDLHSLLSNYYKIVIKWGWMFNDEELINVISKMLVQRSCEINDLSCSLTNSASINSLNSKKTDNDSLLGPTNSDYDSISNNNTISDNNSNNNNSNNNNNNIDNSSSNNSNDEFTNSNTNSDMIKIKNFSFIQNLDDFEKDLLKLSHDSYKDLKIWQHKID